jgi:hypothetical protein
MTTEQKEKYLKAIEAIRPEAKEFVDAMMNEPIMTTENNYGQVMAFLSTFDNRNLAKLFLVAMVREGYPRSTAGQISQILWGIR